MNAIAAHMPAQSDRRRWIALVIVCLGQLMIVLDSTIVNVALPVIQRDLHFTQASLTWVMNAYLITFGSFLLMAGRLGDLIGRKRVFLAGLVVFTIASAACALSQSGTMLIASRFVQGFGGALASSVIIALIVAEFPLAHERAKAMSVFTFVAVGGGSIGLILGGIITQAINWHWIFFINLPIGVIAFALGRSLIDDNEGLGLDQGVDYLGSILVTLAMMTGIYAIVESSTKGWGSPVVIVCAAAAVVLLVSFFVLESRISNPIFPLRILRLRSLVASSAVRSFLVIGMFALFFLGALYLEKILGYSSLKTGLSFLPMTVIVATLSLGITARLMRRFGAMALVVPGMLLAMVGLLLMTQVSATQSFFPLVFVAFVFLGFGMGLSFLPLLTIAMAEVPKPDAGLASGIINVSMQMSAALGLAVLGTIAADRGKALAASGVPLPTALTNGFHLSFFIAAGCVAVGIVVALTILRPVAAMATADQSPAERQRIQEEAVEEAAREGEGIAA